MPLGDREPPRFPGFQIMPVRRRRPPVRRGDRLLFVLLALMAVVGGACMALAKAQMAGLL